MTNTNPETALIHRFFITQPFAPALPSRRLLQDRLTPFAANYIEQNQRWAFGLLGAALQLRDVARGEIEVAGEGCLAQVGALSQAANFFACLNLATILNLDLCPPKRANSM